MTNELKEVIENADIAKGGKYNEFLLIPTDRKYDGFWGVNGYNNLEIYARLMNAGEPWVKLDSGQVDAFWVRSIKEVNFDVPSEYECIRLWTGEPLELEYQASTVSVAGERCEEWEER